MCPLLALVFTASSAFAEDAAVIDPAVPPAAGSVALYLQAPGLYRLGLAEKDPLLVLTAARILHGPVLT